MKVELDSNSNVIGYVLVGDNSSADIVVDESKLPEDFFEKFQPGYYKYSDGNILLNPDFVEPKKPTELDLKTSRELIADLTEQIATMQINQAEANAKMLQQIAQLQAEKGVANG